MPFLLGGGGTDNNFGGTTHASWAWWGRLLGMGAGGGSDGVAFPPFPQSLRQVRLNEILLDYSREAALVVM